MRAARTVVAVVGLFVVAASGLPAMAVPDQAAPQAASVYIVTLVDGASARQVASEHAAEHGADVQHVYEHALTGYAARMSPEAAARISRDGRVRAVEADQPVSIAKRPSSGGTATPSQTLPTGIDRIDGELSSTFAGNGGGSVDVDVAVIDTGIDTGHADLTVAGGKNCASGKSYKDGNGHGTHVAGTIGAKDNGAGVVGVAPGARLWSVRVLDNAGSGWWSWIICGVDWVTANRGTIEVANMSLGGTGSEPSAAGCSTGDALHDAICRSVSLGVTYAVAAGNSDANAANSVPAAYDEVITVSALADFDGLPGGLSAATCRDDEDDTLADFSNVGTDVDLIAPGVCIRSTWKGGGYATISGTSMASPHVAGAAALYKATNPGASPSQVKTALQNAGTTDWDDSEDPDGVKEKLLRVATL